MTITVIIPSYNRVNELDQVLDSYYLQKDVKEVIIIDDFSSQNYAPIINKYIEKYPNIITKYFRNESNLGAGASRNVGIRNACCDYILWGEDDAFLASNYTCLLEDVVNHNTIAFGSIYYGITPSTPQTERKRLIKEQQNSGKKLFNYDTFDSYYRVLATKQTVPFAHALILVEREAYNSIKYYEGYKVNGFREETDAQVLMVKNGYNIIYVCEAQCYHFPPRSGGQHTSWTFKSDFYKIKNNNVFWDRHYEFLKNKYNLRRSKFSFKYHLLKLIIKNHFKGICQRIKMIKK